MRIAVIGAGFTGLACAVKLIESDHQVEIFEKDSLPGGLAIGFKPSKWIWSLEKHYHHLFTSDIGILNLAKQVNHKIHFYRPNTSTWITNGIFPLDSPLSLLKFPGISFSDRLRTGVVLAFLKLNPFWKPLEKITTEKFIISTMGKKSWDVIWKPLMINKFGEASSQISAAWFWARVFKRSSSLGYPDGGFQKFAQSVSNYIINKGGKIHFNTEINNISDLLNKYDKVICTLPYSQFIKIYPEISQQYRNKLNLFRGIGAVNLVLSLNKSFLPHNIYWLNVNVPNAPFLCVVEHTNFISSDKYANQHLLYIGNYQKSSHEYFHKTPDELIKIFTPYLKKINPEFNQNWIIDSWVWTAPFAQPIVPINYSKIVPSIQTPVKNLYLANIQQVYPWDRGTNYAVELGNKVAKICLQD